MAISLSTYKGVAERQAARLRRQARGRKKIAGTAERPWAVIASALTFVTLLVYLGFGIASFVQARRNRA